MRISRKFMALALTLCLALTMIPGMAMAVDGESQNPDDEEIITSANPSADPSASPVPTGTGGGIDLKYIGGNGFSSSKPDVPTGVEIDGEPVSFTGDGRNFTVSCIKPDAKWVTVRWNSTSVTTNFTPDADAYCSSTNIPKTGDASLAAFVVMAIVAAAGAMRRK